jgi:LAGLIDADG DNA endonuclease family
VGNTVGSLSELQHSIVIGTLLGDGAMRCKTNALLEINHSVHQQTYVDWKFGHLAELVSTPPKQRAGNGGRTAYRFVTRSLPELTPYYRLFYSAGRKVAPEVVLTPQALAVWMMDDGSRSRRALYLNNAAVRRCVSATSPAPFGGAVGHSWNAESRQVLLPHSLVGWWDRSVHGVGVSARLT